MADLIDPKKLVTLKHAASLYGYNAEHLRQVAVTGRLRAWFVSGTVWLTTAEHLEEYIHSRQRTALKPFPARVKHRKTR